MNLFSRQFNSITVLSLSLFSIAFARKANDSILNSINQKLGRIATLVGATSTVSSAPPAGHNQDAILSSINQKVSQINTALSPQTYDYIIVGLGTAGGILARHLSDNFSNSVLVLEAGANYSTDPNITAAPFDSGTLAWALEYLPKYALATQVIDELNFPFGGGQENYGSGRMWGGSSAHNYLLTVRGTPDIYNEWATIAGNSQWLYDNLLPYMKYLETYNPQPGAPAVSTERGTAGAIQVTQDPLETNANVIAFCNTVATQMGCTGCNYVATGQDYNISSQPLGVYAQQEFMTPGTTNFRSFVVNAFLNPTTIVSPTGQGLNGRQLTIESNAVVDKVIFSGTTATGVAYIQNDIALQASARKQVILCAGAPLSGAILQRSGIGSSAVLQAAGVPVMVDNPNVGNNFRDQNGIVAAISVPNANLPEIFAGKVCFADGSTVGATGNSTFTTGNRNFELLINAPIANTFITLDVQLSNTQFQNPYVTMIGWDLRPQSEGTAYITTSNPFVLPQINYGFYSDSRTITPGSDLSGSRAMLEMINNIAVANGGNMFYPPVSQISNPAAIEALLIQFGSIPNHYSGSCNMGTSIANSVVSGTDLHVWGTSNLMVADNSVAPLGETGNTCCMAYYIGLMASHILGALNL